MTALPAAVVMATALFARANEGTSQSDAMKAPMTIPLLNRIFDDIHSPSGRALVPEFLRETLEQM
jgi:hypothetical protein